MDRLVIRLVGPFAVLRGGRVLSAPEVGSRKARSLLAALATERGTLPLDRIVAAVWPQSPPRQPAENVATLVSRIRSRLGPDVIGGGRSGYRLGDVEVDVHEARLLLTDAESRLTAEPALAVADAQRAVAVLDASPVLAGEPDADWVRAARAEQSELIRRSRRVLAAAALRIGQPALARDAASAALVEDPYDEDACRSVMRAFAALGEPVRALAVFERLRATLADDLGVDPSAGTRALHLTLLREEVVGAADSGAVVAMDEPGSGTPEAGAAAVPGNGLVGRGRELDRLAGAWHRAAAGRGALIVISGEAGIGKTRLAGEIAARATATAGQVLSARCYEAERSLFLQPVVEALAGLVVRLPADRVRAAAGDRAGALAALVGEVATLLGAPAGELGSPAAQRRRSYDAVVTFLRRLSRDGPVLLLVDDLQNAGNATVELLHYLARQIGDSRLLVLATVRAGEGHRALTTLGPVAEVLELGALDTEAITTLAAAAGQLRYAAQIERRTKGHTLFVVESLRALAAGEPGVPASLRAGVLTRVERAGPAAEELLRAAAVLGSSFAPATVAGLLGVGVQEATRRCERILDTRLTVVAGRAYEFANDLVQEVLYAALPEPTRIAHHLRAADLLGDNPEAVARHADAGGDHRRAARAWLTAGRRAAERYATADAEALFKRAVVAAGWIDDAELCGRAHLARGRVRETSFRLPEALSDYTAATRLGREIGDQRLEMAALRALGGPAWVGVGRPVDEAVGHVREGLRLAEQLGDRGAEARLLSWLSILDCNRLEFAAAAAHAHRALDAARASGDQRAVAAALDSVKTVHAYLGEVDRLTAVLDELEPLLRRTGDLTLLQWTVFESAFPHIAAGRWDVADRLVVDAAAISARGGYTGYRSWYVAHRGWLARLAGRTGDALAHGRQAVEMDSHAWFEAAVLSMYASTLIDAGRPGEAVPLLERGLEVCARHRTAAYRLRCLAPLAEATGSRALLDEADATLRSLSLPPGSAWLYGADAYLSVARAWQARGEPERAGDILAPLLAASERTGWTAPLAAYRSSASIPAARRAPSVSTGR